MHAQKLNLQVQRYLFCALAAFTVSICVMTAHQLGALVAMVLVCSTPFVTGAKSRREYVRDLGLVIVGLAVVVAVSWWISAQIELQMGRTVAALIAALIKLSLPR